MGWGQFSGESVAHYKVQERSAVGCATLSQSRCRLGCGNGWVHGSICYLAPGEYDWTVSVRRRRGLMSNYLDHLLWPPYAIWQAIIFSSSGFNACPKCAARGSLKIQDAKKSPKNRHLDACYIHRPQYRGSGKKLSSDHYLKYQHRSNTLTTVQALSHQLCPD